MAIVGSESSGKTFLAEKLAARYGCLWVPEYARTYLAQKNIPYTKEDVEHIARGQLAAEDAAAAASGKNGLLICDTNLLVIKIWMEHKYGAAPAWIDGEIATRKYALHLLTAPDIPYEHDPLRENPELGKYFFEKYEKLLLQLNLPFAIISGSQRVESAARAIDALK